MPDQSARSAPGTPPAAPIGYSVCTDPLYQGAIACLPNSKDPVCADPSKIVKLEMSHYYWVKAVDADAQTVTLANPWGAHVPAVTWPWTRLEKSLPVVVTNTNL